MKVGDLVREAAEEGVYVGKPPNVPERTLNLIQNRFNTMCLVKYFSTF